MNTAPWLTALWASVFLAQWLVPAAVIRQHEMTLTQGRLYRFRTQPVDPYDAFRGRYVALGFDDEPVPLADPDTPLRPGRRLYATLEPGTNGFARLGSLSARLPESGDYLAVTFRWAEAPGRAHVELPFDRYYLNERLAPAAEQAYREHVSRGRQDAWVTVRVLAGRAVIEDLVLAGRSIRDVLADPPRRDAEPARGP